MTVTLIRAQNQNTHTGNRTLHIGIHNLNTGAYEPLCGVAHEKPMMEVAGYDLEERECKRCMEKAEASRSIKLIAAIWQARHKAVD